MITQVLPGLSQQLMFSSRGVTGNSLTRVTVVRLQ